MFLRKMRYVFVLLFCYLPAIAQQDMRSELNKWMLQVERVYGAKPDSLEYYAQKALPLAIKLNDIAAETRIQAYRATYTFIKGKFDSAVAIGLGIARKGEHYPPYIELAILYYELSGIYGKNKYMDISGSYIRKGLVIATLLNNDTALADGYNRLGTFYERQAANDTNLLDSALYFYEQSRDINDRLGHLLGKSYSLENIAGIYGVRKNLTKALFFFRQALELKQQLGNRTALAIIFMNMGEIFSELKQYDSSIFYTNKAREVASEINYKDLSSYAYQFLAGIYEKKGDLKTALWYHKRFSELNDSLYNETRTKQLAELNTLYETEKKEQQIKTLNQQTEIQSLQIRQRNIFIVAGTILMIIALIFAWLAYNRRMLKEQAAVQIAINRQQEITAREVIHAEERERRRIAADLHDGVGQLLSAALMNLNNLFNKTQMTPESKTLATHSVALVTESYDELRQISHQMIPNTLLKAGLASAVKDMIMRIDQSKMSISLEATGLSERMNEEVETVLYRVIQESVNNVIKHAGASKLNIQLVRDEEGVAITIEDNGKGFDMKQKDKGIGLKNMLSRVQFHKGTIDIDSSPGKGTLVAVFIPLSP